MCIFNKVLPSLSFFHHFVPRDEQIKCLCLPNIHMLKPYVPRCQGAGTWTWVPCEAMRVRGEQAAGPLWWWPTPVPLTSAAWPAGLPRATCICTQPWSTSWQRVCSDGTLANLPALGNLLDAWRLQCSVKAAGCGLEQMVALLVPAGTSLAVLEGLRLLTVALYLALTLKILVTINN